MFATAIMIVIFAATVVTISGVTIVFFAIIIHNPPWLLHES